MAAAAKRSICSSPLCGTYDRSGIRFVCGECLREHLGPRLPSFAERLERFAALAAEARRYCSSPSPSFSSSSTVTAEREEEEEEVDGPGRLGAVGDGRPLRDCFMAPHLRRQCRPVKHDP